MLLQRKLHLRKWRALLTLTLGVVLISHEAMPKSAAAGDSRAKLAFAEFLLGATRLAAAPPPRHLAAISPPSRRISRP